LRNFRLMARELPSFFASLKRINQEKEGYEIRQIEKSDSNVGTGRDIHRGIRAWRERASAGVALEEQTRSDREDTGAGEAGENPAPGSSAHIAIPTSPWESYRGIL
jgi:hypothetical protein